VHFTTTSASNEVNPQSTVEVVQPSTSGPLPLPNHQSLPSLAGQIDAILTSTTSLSGIGAVRRIFNDLVRLLECLRLMEQNLHHVRETLLLLELIRIDTIELLDFTENEALKIEDLGQNLYEVLDGMSFALRHEVRRVFEDNAEEPNSEEPPEITHAKLGDAHRVLTNCLQQSIITLAQVFDPRLDGRQLFNNSKARLKQSLILCKDLWTLTNLVKRAERDTSDHSLSLVLRRIESFRSSSMHFLMYKDWGHFERLARELETSVREQLDCGQLLHKLLTYLETLLGQVKNRAVLAELMPDVLSNQVESHEDELEWSTDELRLTFELYMAG
jgi:hypothetical protein